MEEGVLRVIIREEIQRAINNVEPPDKLLTTEDVATMLDCKPQTLCLWRSKGNKGPNYRKISKNIRYLKSEVQEWIERQTVAVG